MLDRTVGVDVSGHRPPLGTSVALARWKRRPHFMREIVGSNPSRDTFLSADGAPDGRSRAVRAVGRTDPRETRSVRRGRFGAETYAPVARAPKRRDPYDVADLEPKRTRGRPYGPPKGAIRTTRPIWVRAVRAVDCTDPQEARSVRRGRFGAETYARSAVRTPKRRDPHDAADLRPNLTRGRPYGPPRAAIRTTWPVFATNGYGPPYAPRRPARTMLPILATHRACWTDPHDVVGSDDE